MHLMMFSPYMDDSERPSVVYHCLSAPELQQFLDLIAVPYEWLTETSIKVYATAGPVIWEWAPAINQFCVNET